LIFSSTREGTSELASHLRRRNYQVVSLSSLLSQANRERALDAFRSGESPILVATDVAARGLDIDDIDLVINFDPPMTPSDYVHRIGRTGRAEKSGKAVTFVGEMDGRRAADIEKLLGQKVVRVTLERFDYRPIPDRPRGRPRSGSSGRRPPRPGGRERSGSGPPRRNSGGSRKDSGGRRG
jgi:ATP-dependent RNA helicase RhlE